MQYLYVLDTTEPTNNGVERCIIVSDRWDFDYEWADVYYIYQIPYDYTVDDIIHYVRCMEIENNDGEMYDEYSIQVFSQVSQRYVSSDTEQDLVVPATIVKQ